MKIPKMRTEYKPTRSQEEMARVSSIIIIATRLATHRDCMMVILLTVCILPTVITNYGLQN